jgi:hypothetical protein
MDETPNANAHRESLDRTAVSIGPRGLSISGRRFVLPFVAVLLILLGFTLAIAFQFQSIMRRLDDARSKWPPASAELAVRYAAVNDGLSRLPVTIQEDSLRNWTSEYEAFLYTSQYDRQLPHAKHLEEMIQSAAKSLPSGDSLPIPQEIQNSPAIEKWIASEERRIADEQCSIGQWTRFVLRLKLPEPYQPSQ